MTTMKAEKTTAMQAAAVDLLDSVLAGLLIAGEWVRYFGLLEFE